MLLEGLEQVEHVVVMIHDSGKDNLIDEVTDTLVIQVFDKALGGCRAVFVEADDLVLAREILVDRERQLLSVQLLASGANNVPGACDFHWGLQGVPSPADAINMAYQQEGVNPLLLMRK